MRVFPSSMAISFVRALLVRARSYRRTARARRWPLRRWSKCLCAFGVMTRLRCLDAEGLLEAAPSQRGDDDGLAVLHSLHPAEIEAALGERGPHRTGDVWAPLGPIEAESAEVAAGRTPRRELDPEFAQKKHARRRDFRSVVVERRVIASDERIREIDAEAARQVVGANFGPPPRAELQRERAGSR